MFSLGIRLFANMMSGHVLMKVLFGFTWAMMCSGGLFGLVQVMSISGDVYVNRFRVMRMFDSSVCILFIDVGILKGYGIRRSLIV